MVEDKQTKMRETLRLMSLSPWAYAVSYFLFQTVFAIASALIMTVCCFGRIQLFPEPPVPIDGVDSTNTRSIKFFFCAALFCIANIPFSMALSTLFTDSKVANSIGGLIVIIPICFYLQLVAAEE